MTDGFDWHVCREDALAEQFPPLSKVQRERPGSAEDRVMQEFYREATTLKKARLAEATRKRMLAEFIADTQRRHEQQTADYRAHQTQKHTKTPAQSGVYSLKEAS